MDERPDIIFIVLDTQRADRLSCYGYEKETSPAVDRFAREGARFAMGISPAQWTIPSHASFFTGLYPTVHQVTQSNQTLGDDMPHLVEQLASAGYETVGFCNNPLVGVLDNGFRRGFERFYNYGGAAPNRYEPVRKRSWFSKLVRRGKQLFRRLADPIQNYFGRSPLAFRLSLNAWVTPLWSRYANFKGQNERSVQDLCLFLEERERSASDRPLFLFLNLMETHLPFWPPNAVLDRVAPDIRRDPAAHREMLRWNREAYRWAAPLAEPLPALEQQVLSDLYDAEVAYQDEYLANLFDLLRARRNASRTLTVIAGDHGDGLGEHGCVGHAFVAYQELVHVPLIAHWPNRIAPATVVDSAVSTRRIYHTLLDAAGCGTAEERDLTLLSAINGDDTEGGEAYAEVYPPLNFVSAIQHRQPELLERYRCLALRRALVRDNLKLIRVDESADELFDLNADREESTDLLHEPSRTGDAAALNGQLERFAEAQALARDGVTAGNTIELADERLLAQLRGLGYVE